MPPRAPDNESIITKAFLTCLAAVILLLCLTPMRCGTNLHAPLPAFQRARPARRVKIRSRQLRERIYEQALGGRVIALWLLRSAPQRRYTAPPTFGVADGIPAALLRSCRQVYFEARPILHRRNTFHAHAWEFEDAVLAALGPHYLPEIRSLYLCHNYSDVSHARTTVSPLLRQMCLDNLTFEFVLEGTELDPDSALLDAWAREFLRIPTLNRFDVFLKNGDPPAYQGWCSNVAHHLRKLMVEANSADL
ncbi:hypothetical protein B0H17DRAFT_1200892 [Mycena rosella]|uniref:DUF7730 domain-containing protein n=1 Tax=Mycena rosella TaxID=1033263 RepID=A0AAD7DI20_MYCRO|nr:hypothetical protein B0H17DRAFT_1200892 [Mycena rosella]